MILRNLKSVKLLKIIEKQLNFGTKTTEEITDIEMAIYEKSATDFSQNNIDAVKYDCIGLTKYADISKNMYILANKEKCSSDGITFSFAIMGDVNDWGTTFIAKIEFYDTNFSFSFRDNNGYHECEGFDLTQNLSNTLINYYLDVFLVISKLFQSPLRLYL